jgi:hypothetical protein
MRGVFCFDNDTVAALMANSIEDPLSSASGKTEKPMKKGQI